MQYAVVLSLCLLGCAQAAPTAEAPKLRLGDSARPSRYAVDLTIVPDRDTFRGVVDITVEIHTASAAIWLNATALQIQEASFRSDSGVQTAQVIPAGNDFTGLAFGRAVSGPGAPP